MPGLQIDTALARRVLEEGLLDRTTLEGCLAQVRAERARDPEVSLALLLIERQLVSGQRLDPIVQALVGEEPPASRPVQPQLGPYRIVRPLAAGGMGAVYEVEHVESGAHYALKTLHPELVDDEEVRERFRSEAELNARLDHPHVVRIHEASLEGPWPYLVQDLLGGGNLQDRIAAGALGVDEALAVVQQLGQALAHAHARQVIHRDLKPANVLLDEHGHPRLTDFGLARSLRGSSLRLTVTGTLLGTPNYMPPEQAQASKQVGPPADVYGLGGVLYACLTQAPPFPGTAMFAVLDHVLNRPHRPLVEARPDLDGALGAALERLVAQMLSKAPADRPSLEEVLGTVTRLRHGEVGELGLSRGQVRLGLVALLLLATLTVGASWLAHVTARGRATEVAQVRVFQAEGLERELAPWHLGLVAGVAPPSKARVAREAAAVEASLGDLDDVERAHALLVRLRAVERLLAGATPSGPAPSEPSELLVDAILYRRAEDLVRARSRLEAALPGLATTEQPAGHLLRALLASDTARLEFVLSHAPAHCTAVRAYAVERFSAVLQERVGALARRPSGEALRGLQRVVGLLRGAGASTAAVMRAKQAAFEANAPGLGAALRRSPRQVEWLGSALRADPPVAIGPRLLGVCRAVQQHHFARYRSAEQRRGRQAKKPLESALAGAVELDHLLAYAPGSTWVTPLALAQLVELPLLNQGGIKDRRVLTLAAGAALRGAEVTQPAFRALIRAAHGPLVEQILQAHPASQAYRVLAAGWRKTRVQVTELVAWVAKLIDVLANPGRAELANVWTAELRFQVAQGMSDTKAFAPQDLLVFARAGLSDEAVNTLRIEALTSLAADALAALGRTDEVNAVLEQGVRRIKHRLSTRSRRPERWRRSLLRLYRVYGRHLSLQDRDDDALALLEECDPVLEALRDSARERLWVNATRAFVLRHQRKFEQAHATLGISGYTSEALAAEMNRHNVVAEEAVLLTRALRGDAAALALLKRCSAKRISESGVLERLLRELDR